MLQKILFTVSVAALALASDVQPSQNLPTIVELASNDPGLSTLVSALKAANLTGVLTSPGDLDRENDGPFTVFAPSNKAFALLPAATLAHLLDPANIKELQSVLEYHVLTNVAQLKDLKAKSFERTFQGSYLSLSTALNGTFLSINDGAYVVSPDLQASNGVVHVIDKVLIPAGNSNINQILSAKPELSTFLFALEAAGLTAALGVNGPLTRFGDRPGFTVFAPSNEAFAKLPQDTLDHLLDPKNIGELVGILGYHILGGVALSAGCSNGDVRPGTFGGVCGIFDLDVAGFVCTLEGKDVNVRTEVVNGAGTVSLTPDRIFDPNAKFSTIIEKNLGASNGIVHVIDRVLIPPAPTRTIFAAAVASGYTTFVAALKAAALESILNNPALGPYTVFFPTNEAFAKLPNGTLDHLLDPKNIKELQTILEYHIIAGKTLRAGCTLVGRTCGPFDVEGDAMKLGYQPGTVFWTTLEGQYVSVFENEYKGATTFVGDSTNIAAKIQPFRTSLGDGIGGENHFELNGIWHAIDKVLIPKPVTSSH